MAERIYHLALESEWLAGLTGDWYRPARLPEDGFVHCAARDVLLSVAEDYFGGATEAVWVLALDPDRLSAEVRWEAPAPLPEGGRGHLERAPTFPHVYGPIEIGAIVGASRLPRRGAGFAWPHPLG
ncbi:MAG: DUF952 domain-containing protein [Myxococcales bacterium]|nr:DUF952 domain-containing protein [Myxococcales bacterium]